MRSTRQKQMSTGIFAQPRQQLRQQLHQQFRPTTTPTPATTASSTVPSNNHVNSCDNSFINSSDNLNNSCDNSSNSSSNMQAFVFAVLLIGLGLSSVRPMGKGRKGKPSLSARASQPLEEWRELPYDELLIACSEAGLQTSGTAEVLATRVHEYYRDVAENNLMRGTAVVSK